MKIYSINDINDINNGITTFASRNILDTISNKIVNEFFTKFLLNNIPRFYKNFPQYNFDVTIITEKLNKKYISETQFQHFSLFKVIPTNEGTFHKEIIDNKEEIIFDFSNIFIRVLISNSFGKKDYQALNYQLYESIRHELEHTKTYEKLGMPQEDYINLFNQIFQNNNSKTLKENCHITSQYILHPQELPSYARSIYYLSKKLKVNFSVIISQVLDRAFFDKKNDNYTVSPEDKKDPYIIDLLDRVTKELSNEIKEISPKSIFRMFSLNCLPLPIKIAEWKPDY